MAVPRSACAPKAYIRLAAPGWRGALPGARRTPRLAFDSSAGGGTHSRGIGMTIESRGSVQRQVRLRQTCRGAACLDTAIPGREEGRVRLVEAQAGR